MGVKFVYMGPMYIKCGIPLVRVTKQTYCRTTTECASVFKDYTGHCHSPNRLFTEKWPIETHNLKYQFEYLY